MWANKALYGLFRRRLSERFAACFVLHVKFPRKIGNDTTKLRIERGIGQIVFTLGQIRLYIAV